MGLRKKKSLMDQASEYVEAVKPQIESAVTSAKDKALPMLVEAREKAAPVVADARDRGAVALADAREKAGPALADARAKAAPIIASGAALAADKAVVASGIAAEKAAQGRDLAAAKLAEVSGKPAPKKKGGKLKKLLLVTGLAAIGGLVFKKLQGDKADDNWQSSYVPSPPPTAGRAADDSAGSSPDEAVADAAEKPHAVTTPDEPAEVVTIDEDAAKDR